MPLGLYPDTPRTTCTSQERLPEVLPGAAIQRGAEPPAAEGAHGRDWQPLAAHLSEPERALQKVGRGAAKAVQSAPRPLGQGERAGDPWKRVASCWLVCIRFIQCPAVLQVVITIKDKVTQLVSKKIQIRRPFPPSWDQRTFPRL